MHITPLGWFSIVAGTMSAFMIISFLLKKPTLDARQKLLLFVWLGLAPAATAGASAYDGIETTTTRKFCGSCHVMGRHFEDSEDPKSTSLAARHSRNEIMGHQACYVCHKKYGALSLPLTKLNGMKHVWHYHLSGYSSMPVDQALEQIHLYDPFENEACMSCHTGQGATWKKVPDHASSEADIRSNKISCASPGCHGYAHPFSKPFQEKRK